MSEARRAYWYQSLWRWALLFVLCVSAFDSRATSTPYDTWHRDSAANAQCATQGKSPVPLIQNSNPLTVHQDYLAYYNGNCAPARSWAVLSCSGQTGTGTTTGVYTCTHRGTLIAPPNDTTDLVAADVHIECTAGKLLNAYGACVTAASGSCPAHGTNFNQGYYDIGTSPTASFPAYVCAPNSCGLTFSGTSPSGSATVSGSTHYFARGSYDYVGGDPDPTCALTAPSSTSSIPTSTCSGTQQGGYVNGKFVCLDKTTSTTTPTTGAGLKSTSSTVTNGDGSTTTTTSTTEPGGGTTISTETRDTGGNVIERTSTDPLSNKGDVAKFCSENPQSIICKISAWGGTCGAFTCDGDSLQCAMAREQHTRNCQIFDSATAERTLYEAITTGADPVANPADDPDEVSLSSPILQTATLSASCPGDQTIALGGSMGSVVLPWSQLCTSLQLMGSLLVALSMMAAGMIVFKGA